MQVRLRDQDGTLIGIAPAPLDRFPLHTLRHDGMLYERITDGRDGVWEYRATERRARATGRTGIVVDAAGNDIGIVVDAAGNDIGSVALPPGPPPLTVVYHDTHCPLWTVRDAGGRVLYHQPEAT